MRKLGFLASDATAEETNIENTLILPTNYTHSCAIGATGCGKTTGYIYPNLNKRMKEGHGILLFDYKGKESAAVKAIAKRNYRLTDVMEIGVPWGVKINLIKYMNEAEIRELTISIMGLGKNDPYWANTGANIVSSLFKVIGGYSKILNFAEELNLKEHFEEPLRRFNYPTNLTFRAFAEVTKTKESLTNFVIKLPKLLNKFKYILENELKIAFNESSKESVFKEFEDLSMAVMDFVSIIANDITPLKVFEEAKQAGNSSTTFQTIILAMSTTFGAIAEVDAFNEDSIDLVEELNNHKIVVINTKELHSTILSSFVNSLFNELSKRTVQKNIAPISIFIDEAQRVMNETTDIFIDVLREGKVELFLAFQNSQLMIESIGENKFSALLQNLTKLYLFKNILNFKEYETDQLKEFEYYCEDKSMKNSAEALFLDKHELFQAQKEYLILNDTYALLNIQEHSEKGIILFNSHLFRKGQIQIQYEDGFIEIIKINDANLERKAHIFMKNVLNIFLEAEKSDEMEFEAPYQGMTMEDAENAMRIIKKQSRSDRALEAYGKKIAS